MTTEVIHDEQNLSIWIFSDKHLGKEEKAWLVPKVKYKPVIKENKLIN